MAVLTVLPLESLYRRQVAPGETMVTEREIYDRLREVSDPALDGDLVSLGLVTDVEITEETVDISLAFNAPLSPIEGAMCEEIRELCREEGLDVRLYADADLSHEPLSSVKNVVAVVSEGPGVGKTTTAANLAAGLETIGARVGVLDADPREKIGPLSAEPDRTEDGLIVPPKWEGISLFSIGVHLPETDACVSTCSELQLVLTQLLGSVQWGPLDYLVINMPPGWDAANDIIVRTVPVTGAVVVTAPFGDVDERATVVERIEKRSIDVLGAVENLHTIRCPDCGDEHTAGGAVNDDRLDDEDALVLEPLGSIPLDVDLLAPRDANLVELPTEGLTGERFTELAAAVADRVGAVNRSESSETRSADIKN